MGKYVDITGQKFNKLTVIQPVESTNKHKMWLCACECGNQAIVKGSRLRSSSTKSCGCLIYENMSGVTHGLCKLHKKEYGTWTRMKARCTNPNEPSYEDYGARGISVCKEWDKDFTAFFKDMGERPEGMSIERIDNNKGYCPENCRWANLTDQNNNKRCNKFITVNGITKTKAQWAKYLNIGRDTLGWRIKTGKTIENMKEYIHASTTLVL